MSTLREQAREFARLYAEVYALFHRVVKKRAGLTPESMAVLEHFRLAGPLTITEAARHMDRAQSVLSGMVDHLEAKGLLVRIRDARDKRRVLVWLSEKGIATLEREAEVLCPDRLAAAMDGLHPDERESLLRIFGKLLQRPRSPKGAER